MCDFKLSNTIIDQKSNDIANEARVTGNDRFNAKNYLYALNHYNRSIAYAKSKNVSALAYGNRSAVYFQVQLYQECLENIQLARDNGYPADKMSKLNEREIKCKELMDESKDKKTDTLWDFFKLSYPANEKIPWLVDCVEMRRTEKFGRGIYAKQDLKAGDVICVEDAFFNCTIKEDIYNTYFHCYNCFKSKRMNLIPCDKTASIMFCSSACKDDLYSKAASMMDGILCPYTKLLSDVAGFFGNVKAFEDYINRTDLKTLNKTIFDYDLSNPEDSDYKDKRMTCFLSLSTNNNLSNENSCSEKYISKKASNHLMSIYALNQRDMRLDDGGINMAVIGHHISLFSSLINHSCINNAFSMNVGSKIVTILEKPVKAGEQIFFRYGKPLCLLVYGALEKGEVEAIHNFKCDCEACDEQTSSCLEDFFKGAGMNDNTMMYEADPIHGGNYDLGKEKLIKRFNDMNENPGPHKIFSVPLMCCQNILKSAAYLYNYSIPPYDRFAN